MDNSTQISLDNDWLCQYFERETDGKRSAASGIPVPSLAAWTRGDPCQTGGVAYLQRGVYLEPTDLCVSYILHIDSAPGKVVLYVNGRRLGHLDGTRPFHFDITDYMALEENAIALSVVCAAPGSFGAIYLQQVPCE
jgi:hypothetical protein